MKKKTTLLVMAAGMGSRFGSLKQITPLGPHQKALLHYTVYDAVRLQGLTNRFYHPGKFCSGI